MININDVLIESEFTDKTVIKNREKEGIKEHKFISLKAPCEHCKQVFNDDSFNLSIFLYGAVFLLGEKFGYIGFTCPVCLKTNMLKGESLVGLMETMVVFMGPNGSHMNPRLKYHSSVSFSPSQIEHLKSYDIPTWTCPLSEGTKDNFYGMLQSHLDENRLIENGYVCSYNYGGHYPIGVMFSIWWIKSVDIESMLEIENNNGIRVFPRYVHEMEWFKRYDYFCWKYKLYQDYLANLKSSTEEDYGRLREYTYQQDINLDRFLESNPGVGPTAVIEIAQQQAQAASTNDIQAASEFLDLLVNFNPPPWDIPGDMSDCYSRIWKAVNPFNGTSIPDTIEDFTKINIKREMTDDEVNIICDKVRSKYFQNHIQVWAVDHHQEFINEFISLARRSDFSYGLVWDLKCRYLQHLNTANEKETINEARYAFHVEGPSWTIIFNGKAIRGLKAVGFRYIHYLVKNQGQQFHTNQLNELNDRPDENSKFIEKAEIDEMKGADNHIKTDEKAKKQYENRINELQEVIDEAEQNNDLVAKERASAEYEQILSLLEKDFLPSGSPRSFRDDNDKIKDKIVQAIRRAIQKIKQYDPEIAEHFTKALQPINTFQQCYNPDEEVKWHFNS